MTSNITTERPSHEAGFTLIELLVVLSIMALLSAVAVSSFSGNAHWRGRHEMSLLLSAVNETRAKAMETGRISKIEPVVVPTGMQFVTQDGQEPRWFPDGTATPAVLKQDGRILFVVNSMTGLAEQVP